MVTISTLDYKTQVLCYSFVFFSPAMRNHLRRCSSPDLLLIFCSLLLFISFSAVAVEEPLQWQILTERNFSQARLNPHVLTLQYTLWSEAEHGARNEKPKKDAPEPKQQKGNLEIYIIHSRTRQAYTQKLATIDENVPHTPYDSSGARPEITVGSMLVATAKLVDISPLEGSKILIVEADKTKGFQGLIINRLLIWDIMAPIEEGLDPLKDAPLSYGGFLIAPKLPLVALTRVRDEHPEVLPGVYFLDPLDTLSLRQNIESHDWPVTAYWFFLGYSRWGWNQLFDEIADGSWNIINGTVEQLDWPMK